MSLVLHGADAAFRSDRVIFALVTAENKNIFLMVHSFGLISYLPGFTIALKGHNL